MAHLHAPRATRSSPGASTSVDELRRREGPGAAFLPQDRTVSSASDTAHYGAWSAPLDLAPRARSSARPTRRCSRRARSRASPDDLPELASLVGRGNPTGSTGRRTEVPPARREANVAPARETRRVRILRLSRSHSDQRTRTRGRGGARTDSPYARIPCSGDRVEGNLTVRCFANAFSSLVSRPTSASSPGSFTAIWLLFPCAPRPHPDGRARGSGARDGAARSMPIFPRDGRERSGARRARLGRA